MGVWAVPDQETEGDVKLHSLVSTSHYLGIIKKLLSEKKLKQNGSIIMQIPMNLKINF